MPGKQGSPRRDRDDRVYKLWIFKQRSETELERGGGGGGGVVSLVSMYPETIFSYLERNNVAQCKRDA